MIHNSFMFLQRFREGLALALIGLLPFHALMVTVATRLIAGPGHAPLSWLALWKEGVLGVMLVLAGIELLFALFATTNNQQPQTKNDRFDLLDTLIIALLVLSVLVTALTHGNWGLYAFGFRYDFVPLVAFLFLRRVEWREVFLQRAMTVLLWAGALVAGYGILTFFLPAEFFTWLGYSDLHSLYVADGPIAAFQQIGGTALRRIQGPMSGPNHLGLWLLIPLGAVLSSVTLSAVEGSTQRVHGSFSVFARHDKFTMTRLGLFVLLAIALLLTFSRAAWIGACVMLAVTLFPVVRRLSRRALVGFGAALTGCVVLLALLFPSVVIRLSSSRGHLQNPLEAVRQMVEHPFGKGMGTAGPASNRVSDTCVLLLEGDDPTWWKENRPDMCVFVEETQVQPTGVECNCPFLPENWYLQIGVEMGWAGMVLYVWMMALVLMRLRELRMMNQESSTRVRIIHYSLFLILLSTCIAALFLHAFEDAAVAYTLWVLAAVLLRWNNERRMMQKETRLP